MKTRWVVEVSDALYGPFPDLSAADIFCNGIQSGASLKIRTLNDPRPPDQRGEEVEYDFFSGAVTRRSLSQSDC